MDRRAFLKRLGIGSVAAASFPTMIGRSVAFAGGQKGGQRAYDFVALSLAPTTGTGVIPVLAVRGCGVFKPHPGWVKGGGTYTLFNNAPAAPKPILFQGDWHPAGFVSYSTLSLPAYGTIQPSILVMTADFEGFISGATLRLICNVGAAGAAGFTGEAEGFKLLGTSFGDFAPFTPTVVGLTHIGLEGSGVHLGA